MDTCDDRNSILDATTKQSNKSVVTLKVFLARIGSKCIFYVDIKLINTSIPINILAHLPWGTLFTLELSAHEGRNTVQSYVLNYVHFCNSYNTTWPLI